MAAALIAHHTREYTRTEYRTNTSNSGYKHYGNSAHYRGKTALTQPIKTQNYKVNNTPVEIESRDQALAQPASNNRKRGLRGS
jgi:hypothetical protein